MRLTQLLDRANQAVLSISGDAEVTSVSSDSRRCGAGSCFIAVRGPDVDGHQFVGRAVAAGGSAVVCEDAAAVPSGTPFVIVKDTKKAVGPLAQAMLDWPCRKLTTIGITGTKGKSTITYLVRAILEAAGKKAGLLGTISYETGSRTIVANNTTPGPIELASMMDEMLREGMSHLVMEVSSHALHQGRVAGIDFAAAVFTNLTGEHLDYHKTMEEYLAAKRIMFENISPAAAAVINNDDKAGFTMMQAARNAGGRVLTYGIDAACDVQGVIEHCNHRGTQITIIHAGKAMPVFLPLIGRHNVYNCLAAAAACVAVGVEWDTIIEQLGQTVRVPGRLERVPVDAPYEVFVDYAHTDDALKNVLTAVRPMTKGKLITMFGCGGDRDRTKRPRMARVAQELADTVIVTSDNPRNEDPHEIIRQVVAGLDQAGAKPIIEPDRKAAIKLAIAIAGAGDVVILAGKGHENYQIIGTEKTHFDDVEEASAAIKQREIK